MSIQTLRDQSEGIVAKILIGLIILVFALFGFGSITTFLAPVPKVATVNGDAITQQEMETAVERNRRLLLAQNRSPADIDEDELRRSVLQNLIDRKLLSLAADDLGLYFGEKEVDEDIVNTPVFQVDGVFNPDQFQLVIRGAGYTPLSYRQEMSTDKKLQQLVSGVQGSSFLTKDEIVYASSLAQQTRDIAFLRIDLEKLIPVVEVTDQEVEQYYTEHPGEFMTEETVDLDYVELKRDDLMQKVAVTEDALRAYFEENKSVYAQEESRRIAHILIETNDKVTDAQAKARIDKIYDRIVAGESFSDVARESSEDPGSARNGGDLGYNSRGTFDKAFEDAAFALQLNQVSKPVKTDFGYHLIKILDIRPAQTPDFASVRDKVEKQYREEKAEEMFVADSGQLSELAFESPDLQEPADALGLEIKTTGYVGRDVKEGIAANSAVMEAAFSPDVLLDGNNSGIIEISPNDHVVIHVRDHKPRELKPLEQVAADVKAQLAEQKATELAESQARDIVDMLESGSITRFVADKYKLKWEVVPAVVRNQPGIDRAILSSAFKLPRPPEGGKSVGYTMLADGDAAVFSVTRVVNKAQDNLHVADLDRMRRALANQRGAYEFREFRDELADEGDVTKTK